MISLIKLTIGEEGVICKIENKNKSVLSQLNKLGFFVGEKIKLLNYNYNKESYLVKIMGINYAIDKSVCEGIFVSNE